MAHHYSYGSGMSGCLYDYGPHFCDTKEQAIDGVLFIFEEQLPEEELALARENLELCGIHYFSRELRGEAGADYCEVSKHTGERPEEDE